MSFRLVSVWAVLAATTLVSACNDDGEPCDPGQVLKDHLCLPGPKPEAGPPDAQVGDDVETPDGEVEDVITDAGNDPPLPPGMFGTPCTMAGDTPECTPPAPYCAVRPGATSGYCSALGCDVNPSICPLGWSCFTVANISVCTKPP